MMLPSVLHGDEMTLVKHQLKVGGLDRLGVCWIDQNRTGTRAYQKCWISLSGWSDEMYSWFDIESELSQRVESFKNYRGKVILKLF
mmetsp:Transcript_35060/g.71741  ORF Transcript_35060/g.71741 Transcript_35060/m.71741 type:complete len:86 (+) Transcript_35060:89-346(+)